MDINFSYNTVLHETGAEVIVVNDRSHRYDTLGKVLDVDRVAWSYLVSFEDGNFWYTHEELEAV